MIEGRGKRGRGGELLPTLLPGDSRLVPEARAVLDELDADLGGRLALRLLVSVLPSGRSYFPHRGREGDVMLVLAITVGGTLDRRRGLAERRRLGRRVALLWEGRLRVGKGDGDGGVAAAGSSAQVGAVVGRRVVLLAVVDRLVKVGAAAQHQPPAQGGKAGHRVVRRQWGALGDALFWWGDVCGTVDRSFDWPGGGSATHFGWRLTRGLGRRLSLAAGNSRSLR